MEEYSGQNELKKKLDAVRAKHQPAIDALAAEAAKYAADTRAAIASIQDPVMKAALIKDLRER